MFAKQLHLKQTWDGQPIRPSEQVCLLFTLNAEVLKLTIQSPFYDDAPPRSPAGLTQSLWEYEVVELFLLGASGEYLEIELGPHGHYLIYFLSGVRVVERRVIPLDVMCTVNGARWQGDITIARCNLPGEIMAVNGYAMHGQGEERHYLTAASVPGETPDFHQPKAFLPLAEVVDLQL